MALIDIAYKTPEDDLTANEFNQLLDAIKEGIKDIKTLNLEASTATFNGLVQCNAGLSVNGESGPFAKYWESTNVIYVSKGGGTFDNDVYDGKSINKALNSFQNAIDNVVTIHGTTPTEANPVAIICIDGGIYEENIICEDHVDIWAPQAILKLGGTGSKQLIIKTNKVSFHEINRDTGSNYMILSSATTDNAFLSCNTIRDAGTGAAVSNGSIKPFYVYVDNLEILGGGIGISDDNSDGHIHVEIHSLYLGSNNATGIYKTHGGMIHGRIGGITYGMLSVTGTTGIVASNGTVSLNIIDIKAHTAFNISGSGHMDLYANEVIGTEIVTGTASVVTPDRIQAAIDLIASKEDGLGNPSITGQVLTSTTGGVRSWKTTGDMQKIIYDPTNILADVFKFENQYGKHIQLDITGADTSPGSFEGRLSWNPLDKTLNIDTGIGAVIQAGLELLIEVYNDTGGPLLNGRVVRKTGSVTAEGVPHVIYAQADTHINIGEFPTILTQDLADGATGFATVYGKVRDIDTSTLLLGEPAYLSATNPGEMTSTRPEFPNYQLVLGVITKVGALDGEIVADVNADPVDTVQNFWNGTMRESFDFLISSDGTTITGSLERSGGGDLTMIFDSGLSVLDCTPIQTITLTAGTNSIPAKNYVYIPRSTKTLTVSTVDWPAEAHIRIADCVLQSASYTQLYGALNNRNWNDHIQGTDGQGDQSHIGMWIRNRPSSWYSGVQGGISIISATAPDNVYYNHTSGKVFQKHLHTVPAFNQQTGGKVFVVNHPTTKYFVCSNLNTQLLDSQGVSMAGDWFNLVFWGVANKTGTIDQVMMNLPNGSYGNEADAISDISNYNVYTIPSQFNGSGFLIAKFTFRHQTQDSGIWTLLRTVDLRGVITTQGGGGIGGTGATAFTGLTDTPASYVGQQNRIVKVNAGATGLEFLAGASGTFTTADAKTVTVTNGVITSIV